jgi:hypothetical protein
MMISIFSNKLFFNLGMYIVFRHNAIAHLIDYSIV